MQRPQDRAPGARSDTQITANDQDHSTASALPNGTACNHWANDAYCGAPSVGRYMMGYRRLDHTPAQITGRPAVERASSQDPPMADAAVAYALKGRPVFPGNGLKKRPHWEPRTLEHGHLDASTDSVLVRRWFTKCPFCSPVPPEWTCLDFDPRYGGTREALEAVVGPLPVTLTVWSGREDGGHHLFYLRPKGAQLSLSPTKLKKYQLGGIDLKDGGKGYTVLPPSLHAKTGKPYRWESHPVTHPTPALVEFLKVEAIPVRPAGTIKPTVGKLGGLMRTVGESEQRETSLFWALCRAMEAHYPDKVLDDICQITRDRGLPEGEIRNARRQAQRIYGVTA